MVDTELLEKKDLRDKMSDRVEVLDKVKKLLLIPKLDLMTMKQVADYYSSFDKKDEDGNPAPQIIDVSTVKKCYQRNKIEIDSDGTYVKKLSDFLTGHFVPLEKSSAKSVFKVSDEIIIEVPNRGIRCFSKRAVLRIGMLLRDSDIAKEVRTQLLNTFEHSTDEQKTADIDEETSIMLEIGRANMDGDEKAYKAAVIKAFAFKNRKNEALQAKNNELATNNKALAGEALTWTTRDSVNKAVRVIAGTLNQPFGYVWKYLYDELLYHHHISLSMRGKPPVLKYLHEDEWPKLIQSLAAVCEKYGLSFDNVMKKAKLSMPKEG